MSGRAGPPATALAALAALEPCDQLVEAVKRLRGAPGGPLARFQPMSELEPGDAPGCIDGRLLEAVADRALGGARGAVFTPDAEARILAAFGLAHAAAGRGGPPAEAALEVLLGPSPRPSPLRGEGEPTSTPAATAASTPTSTSTSTSTALTRALDGLLVLDPACGGGALLAAAERLARGAGARLRLRGLDLAPLAVKAARARLELLGADAEIEVADALTSPWPDCHLLLANPPFLRHEAIPPRQKAAAARASGLSRQADLSAHLALMALRSAPVAALVLPRALLTARSAEPLRAEARARGGFALRLRSRAAGSFAASVDTLLAVWVAGARDAPEAEASVGLSALHDADLLALARRRPSPRLRLERPALPATTGRQGRQPVRLEELCQVRFGMKTGCNAFFQLTPLGAGRFRSALLGEVALSPGDVAPLLASLKEARAPERVETTLVLLRPSGEPSAAARRYLRAGERAGVAGRPTCAGRRPWWRIAPGRAPAPLLYPAKLGARAFAVVNPDGLLEDKKWHALFPRQGPAWPLALVLSATPVRLAIDAQARQLTGAQAIADVDCRVLSAAPVPTPAALAALARELAPLRAALGRDEVTTDLAAMLARPAQRELDLLVGRAIGLSPRAVARTRSELLARVRARLEHAAAVRALLAGAPASHAADEVG